MVILYYTLSLVTGITYEKDQMRFGEVLGFLLESGFGNRWKPWKVDQFGQRLGVASSTVYLWKKGLRTRPRPENLHNIAELLELDPFFASLLYQSVEGLLEVTPEELIWRRDQLRADDEPNYEYLGVKTGEKILPELVSQASKIRLTLGLNESSEDDQWLPLVWMYGRAFVCSEPASLLGSLLSDLGALGLDLTQPAEDKEPDRLEARALLTGLVALAHMEVHRYPEGLRWWRTAERAAQGAYEPFTKAWVMSQYAIEQLYTFRAGQDAWVRAKAAAEVSGWGAANGVLAMAAAKNGKKDEAYEQLAAARVLLADEPLSNLNFDSVFGWSEVHLRYMESYVYTHTKEVEAAQQVQAEARGLIGKVSPLGIYQTLLEIHQGAGLVLRGSVEEGCEMAYQAVAFGVALDGLCTRGVTGYRVHRWLIESIRDLVRIVPERYRASPLVLSLTELLSLPRSC